MAALPLNKLLTIPVASLTLIVDPLSLKPQAVARQRSLSNIPKRAVSFDSGRSRWSTNGRKPRTASTGPPLPPAPPGVGNDVLARVERGMSPLASRVATSIPIKPIRKASPQVSQRKALPRRSLSLDDSSTDFHGLRKHNALYTPNAPPRPNRRPIRKASPVVSQKKSMSPMTFHGGNMLPHNPQSMSSPPTRSPAMLSQKSPSAA